MKQDLTTQLFYDGQWNDAPAYTRDPVTITRGKGDEQGGPVPSRSRATLDNRDGTYNPGNPASSLYGLAGQNTPVRHVLPGDDVRYTGEAASWKPDRSVEFDGVKGDAWTGLDAAGVLRRLGQGAEPLLPALKRAILASGPVAYWPMDDADGSTQFASALPHGLPMVGDFTRIEFAAVTDVPGGTLPLPQSETANETTIGEYTITGPIRGGTTGGFGIGVLWRQRTLPDDASLALKVIDHLGTQWVLNVFFATGQISAIVDGPGGDDVLDSNTSIADGQWHWIEVDFEQSGSDVDVSILIDGEVDATDTFTGASVGVPVNGVVNLLSEPTLPDDREIPQIGAFTVWSPPSPTTMNAAVNGYTGETAADRFLRLCAEEDITASVVGDPDDTAPMGPQPADTLTNVLAELERTDAGILFEPRHQVGLTYRTLRSLYNQTPALQLDWSAGEVALPFRPVLDDQGTRNDVTAKRRNGSSARAVQETGPRNVQAPADDPQGVGRYKTDVDVNPDGDVDLPNLASWYLHLGTIDEVRYPQVTVDVDAAPALAAAAGAVDIGDRITIANLPADLDPNLVSLLVVGSTEDIGSHRRTITFNCVPESAWKVAVYDTDRYEGRTTQLDAPVAAFVPLNSNTDFEAGVSPWAPLNGATLTLSTVAHRGRQSLLLTPNGVSASPEARSENVPGISPGTVLAASAWVRCAASRNVSIAVNWRNSGGSILSTSSAVHAVTAGVWKLVYVQATAPANTTQAQIAVSMGSTPPAGHLLLVDEARIGVATPLTVTADPPWTTAPANFPLDVAVAGERVTVTAITGGSSPQTWTVVRSTNRIDKAHTDGTPIRLYQQGRYAL
jgi:hypothetical protein